jgi:hypothetical protein
MRLMDISGIIHMYDIPDLMPIISNEGVGYQQINKVLIKYVPTWNIEDRMQFAGFITTISRATGIFDIGLLAQIFKETAYCTSPRFTKSNNPAGLGATNDGAWGSVFPSRVAGLFAMAGHLINYAIMPSQQTIMQRSIGLLDPRYDSLVQMKYLGVAPNWIDLFQKWGYIDPKKNRVPGKTDRDAYGMSIVILARELANL